ncbi:carboxypeptidase-like regulatory domain-containing protein [Blastopirellula marina]|uniref:Carboxypeptidase regulatory-like domain-containing protein n=1 Tax=Blastopirellula marina TaxID=124 RepID=A0A2S8GDR4_9BACT|nr:carboxypeptidase-like regulatory domain-containing protein [Blastopirellula marina]PQO42602.1 hypothetical protein C5Y98_01830 [Blastopirellula marina]PTL46368.1 carboxypeptidase regulatory-like domain-containing protein [Blastopirellula marina]
MFLFRLAFCFWVVGWGTIAFAASPSESTRVHISGQVVDQEAKPVANITVRSIAYADVDQTVTDAEGKFTVRVDEKWLSQLGIVADDVAGNRMGLFTTRYDKPLSVDDTIIITLESCTELPVEVVDSAGQPSAGTIVGGMIAIYPLTTTVTNPEGQATLRWPESRLPHTLYALKPNAGFDYRMVTTTRDKTHRADWLKTPPVQFQLSKAETIRIRLLDRDEKPIVGAKVSPWLFNKPGEPDSFNLSFTPLLFTERTDQEGIATFRGIPDWATRFLTFWPSSEELVHQRIEFKLDKYPDRLQTVHLEYLVPVSGHLRTQQGEPLEGIVVHARGAGSSSLDNQQQQATTDHDGKFQLMLAPDYLYSLAVSSEKWGSPLLEGLFIQPGKSIENLVLSARPATHITGRLSVGADASPLPDKQILLQRVAHNSSAFPKESRSGPFHDRFYGSPTHTLHTRTDDQGRYEFFVGPGKYKLIGPSQVERQEFEVFAQPKMQLDLHAPRKESGPFSGSVVTGNPPRPVPHAMIYGIYRAALSVGDLKLQSDENGRFQDTRQLHRMVLYAKSEDGQSAGMLEIGPDAADATIAIEPVSSAEGRLIDHQTRVPLARREITWGRKIPIGNDDAPWRTAWGGRTTTNENGEFKITGLVVGETYQINLQLSESSSRTIAEIERSSAKSTNLGDLPDNLPRGNR